MTVEQVQDLCVLNRIFLRIAYAQQATGMFGKQVWPCDYVSLFSFSPTDSQKSQLWASMDRLQSEGYIRRKDLNTEVTPEGLKKIGIPPKFQPIQWDIEDPETQES